MYKKCERKLFNLIVNDHICPLYYVHRHSFTNWSLIIIEHLISISVQCNVFQLFLAKHENIFIVAYQLSRPILKSYEIFVRFFIFSFLKLNIVLFLRLFGQPSSCNKVKDRNIFLSYNQQSSVFCKKRNYNYNPDIQP